MDEHGFIRYVHSKLSPALRKWKIHDTFAGGVPDAYYLGPRSDLWIEYKYVKTLPKRSTTTVKTSLSELQKEWLDDLRRCKRPAALVIGHEQRAVIRHSGLWNREFTAYEFQETSISRKELIGWIEFTCL